MIDQSEIYHVGKFQKTHALKGELNMICDIDPEYFLDDKPLIVEYEGIWVPYYVESVRQKGSSSYLVKLQGIDSEEEASDFVNKEIYILKKDAETLLQEEYEETMGLVGYNLIDDETGTMVGEIVDIDDSTVNVLFIVKSQNDEEIYIPANEDLLVRIDDDKKEVIMKLPEGLFNINDYEN